MAEKKVIATESAPAAIGPYSQAVQTGNLVFLSGQIPLDPETMEIVEGCIEAQANQVLKNLAAVAEAAGGSLDNAVRITIFLTNLGDFATVNEIMKNWFNTPYPARATVQVSALPRGALIEIDAILAL